MGNDKPSIIYYVEDDANIRDLTLYALSHAGLEGVGLLDAEEFFDACERAVPDLVLLDIMLPGTDGLQILSRIRRSERLSNVPVMMLTAKGTELDTVNGLDAGADDYLAKPFSMLELVSRVNALLRRSQRSIDATASNHKLEAGPIVLDVDAHSVQVEGVPVSLTLKEFELLHALMQNAGRALTRAQLFEQVWGSDFFGGTRTVDVHVQTLRQKLERAREAAGSQLETVRGVGYRMRP